MRFSAAVLVCVFTFPALAQSTSMKSVLPDAPEARLAADSAPANGTATMDGENLALLHWAIPDGGQPTAASSAATSATGSPFSSSLGDTFGGYGQATQASGKTIPPDEQQPKRILGMMPNYRAVSAGVRPPPPGPKESFIIATENNFDYSQFVFVGLTSLMAEGTNTHPEFGKGAGGYWSYYWRGYIDKSDGDYLIIFVFPTLFREDERYFAMGQGGFWKRVYYSGSSVFITPNYHGKNTFNWAEILGRGVSQAVSLTYYPSAVAAPSSYMSKFGYAVGSDELTNVFREFYPDMARIASRPFHHKHKKQKSS